MNYSYIMIAFGIGVIVSGLVFVVISKNISQERLEEGIVEEQKNDTTPQKNEPVVSDIQPSKDAFEGEALDLQGKGLTNVPASVFEKTTLEKLDLSHNNLEGSLPAEVRLLRSLRVLDLSDNSFTGVPAEIGQLTNLEELDLSNNKITGLPYELGALQNLRVLDLRGNAPSLADLEKIKETLPTTTTILLTN